MVNNLNVGSGIYRSDEVFDACFSLKIQKLSCKHWTPVSVAIRAAGYLVDRPGTKILDIGSGVGKFCIVAAACSKGHFTGVEQRENLVRISAKIAKRYEVPRVNFIHANIKSINFSNFNGFYFFNSFEENLDPTDKIDEEISFSPEAFLDYSKYMYSQFEAAPIGTKLVTYCTASIDIPESYLLVKIRSKGKLKFWKKSY